MMEDSDVNECLLATHDLSVTRNPIQGGCCCSSVREEFKWKNILFGFEKCEAFYTSEWPLPKIVFIVYRVLLSVYTLTVTFVSIVGFSGSQMRRPWPVWLTHWSYFMLTCHLLCAAVVVILHAFFRNPVERRTTNHRTQTEESPRNIPRAAHVPFYLKLNWLLFAISAPAALLVTGVYFVALFPQKKVDYLNPEDVNLHLMNTVIVLLELCVSAFPVRLLHYVYMFVYGALYATFSIIYWSVDHTHVLYPGVLDWNYPKKTGFVLIILALVILPLLQIFVYCVYRVRIFIRRICCRAQ